MTRRCTLEFIRNAEGAYAGQWRWRFLAANGRTTGWSETYKNRVDCVRSAELTTGCYGVRRGEQAGEPYCFRPNRTGLVTVNVRWIR